MIKLVSYTDPRNTVSELDRRTAGKFYFANVSMFGDRCIGCETGALEW